MGDIEMENYMVIRADYNLIDKRLCELSKIIKEVKNELEVMDDTIENIGIFWESDAGSEYAIRITSDMLVILALAEKIGQTINSMRDAVGKLDKAETQIGILIREK